MQVFRSKGRGVPGSLNFQTVKPSAVCLNALFFTPVVRKTKNYERTRRTKVNSKRFEPRTSGGWTRNSVRFYRRETNSNFFFSDAREKAEKTILLCLLKSARVSI